MLFVPNENIVKSCVLTICFTCQPGLLLNIHKLEPIFDNSRPLTLQPKAGQVETGLGATKICGPEKMSDFLVDNSRSLRVSIMTCPIDNLQMCIRDTGG